MSHESNANKRQMDDTKCITQKLLITDESEASSDKNNDYGTQGSHELIVISSSGESRENTQKARKESTIKANYVSPKRGSDHKMRRLSFESSQKSTGDNHTKTRPTVHVMPDGKIIEAVSTRSMDGSCVLKAHLIEVIDHVMYKHDSTFLIYWKIKTVCRCGSDGLSANFFVEQKSAYIYGKQIADYMSKLEKTRQVEHAFICEMLKNEGTTQFQSSSPQLRFN